MEDLPRGVSLSESDSDDSTIPPPDLDFETYVDVVSVFFFKLCYMVLVSLSKPYRQSKPFNSCVIQ